MATKKFLDSTGISSLWLKVMQEFSNLDHKHDDSYLSLGGGTVNGDITANKFVTAGATADSAVLGDGSALDVSALQVSATDKLPERFLWRNRFDGTADLSGDIMIQTGLSIDGSGNDTYIGFGNDTEQNITIGSAKISDTSFKYKDGDVLHKGNFTYNGTDSTIYAPTSTGDVNDILASVGTGAPTWNKPADISVGTVLTTVESDVTGTTQATEDSTTKIATTEFVHNAASTGIATLTNALIYKGTIGTGGTVEALPENYSVGDTYKVITPGTYAGHVCEVGDMIVAIEGGWTVVQNNTDIATSSVTGMVKGGTTVESEKIYGINVSGTGAMTVSVPWDDTTGLAEVEVMDLIESLLHPDYMAFTALEDGTFSFVKEGNPTGSVSYSLDNGSSWNTLNYGDSTPTVTTGSKVLWKGNYKGTSDSDYGSFSSTGKFNVSGNIMSLMYGDDFKDKTDLTGCRYCFYSLFRKCSNLVDVPNLILPATSLAEYCYSIMFSRCTSLTTAPELPATTLATSCYNSMFDGCTSLTTAPVLPATTLATSCYHGMFYGCTSLTSAPVLPATSLAERCYNQMFSRCTSLTTAPELPATTLASSCYGYMFNGCKSLTTAPALPATTLAENCYREMFYGCTSLTTAPELPATELTTSCYEAMFRECWYLTTAPELPATTLAEKCYYFMFYNCKSLTTAPQTLPATTLASYCYQYMFYDCKSLTTAPVLPATKLATSCYKYMFNGCSKLNYIKAMTITTPSGPYTDSWVSGVSKTGTFVKNAAAKWNVTGNNGVPTGWTVEMATA